MSIGDLDKMWLQAGTEADVESEKSVMSILVLLSFPGTGTTKTAILCCFT